MTRGYHFARDKDLTDNQEGKVDPVYLAQVEKMTDRRERAYRLREQRDAAKAALVAAEDQVVVAKRSKNRAAIREAWALVKRRQDELAYIERLMTGVPGASSKHRGVKSTWPVADPEGVQRGDPERWMPRTSDGKRHPVNSTRP